MTKKKILVFGASGTLGSACVLELQSAGFETIAVGRDLTALNSLSDIDGAVWAQGANYTGKFTKTTRQEWDQVWDANFDYIVRSLEILFENNALRRGARLVIISSVWQEVSRAQKVAYIASKAAVGGLVRGLATDLGPDGVAINAVLPGVVVSPMTYKNLTVAQIDAIAKATPGGELVTPEEVAKTVAFLIDESSSGINGQSIVIDKGWSITRNV